MRHNSSLYDALDQELIAQRLLQAGVLKSDRLHVFDAIDSTNRFLLDWPDVDTLNSRVCLTEHQTAGRGRRGKEWHDSPGGSVMLSIGWTAKSARKLSGLSLCVGVAVVRALNDIGIQNAQLKWPNDILWGGRKLGGILVETSKQNNQTLRVVAGVGLNVRLSEDHAATIDQPWIDLTEIQKQTGIDFSDRNTLAAQIIVQLEKMFVQFSSRGFASYRDGWLQNHAYQNCMVDVVIGNQTLQGMAVGVDYCGALQIRIADGEIKAVNSGEVSVRLV